MIETVIFRTLAELDCGLGDVHVTWKEDLEMPFGMDGFLKSAFDANVKKAEGALREKGEYEKLIRTEENGYPALYGIPKGKTEPQRIRVAQAQSCLTDYSVPEDKSSIDITLWRIYYPYLTETMDPKFQEFYDKAGMERPLGGLSIGFMALTSDDKIVTAKRGLTTFKHGYYGPGGNWNYGLPLEKLAVNQITSEFKIAEDKIKSIELVSLNHDVTGANRPELGGIAYIGVNSNDLVTKTDLDTDVKKIVSLGEPSRDNLLNLLREKSPPAELDQNGEWEGLLLVTQAAILANAGRHLYSDFEQRFQQLKI